MRTRITLIAAALALCAATPARAAAPSVAGHTTITGDTGYTLVHLDGPLEFSFEDDSQHPTFAFHGPSALTGIALRAEQADEDGNHPGVFAVGDSEGYGFSLDSKLPAGDYRLFLLAPDGRASAEMTLPGLAGEAAVSPTFSASLQKATVSSKPSAVAPNTLVAGKTVDLATDGAILTEITADFPGTLKARRTEWCDYFLGAGEVEPSNAYEPTCPGGFSFPGDPLLGQVPTGQIEVFTANDGLTGVTSSSARGRFGLGGNFTFLEGPPKVSATYRWISFGTPGVQLTADVTLPQLLKLRLFYVRGKAAKVGTAFTTDLPIETHPGLPTVRASMSLLGSEASVSRLGSKRTGSAASCYHAVVSKRLLSRLKLGHRYAVGVSIGTDDESRTFTRKLALRRAKSERAVAKQLGC